MRPSALANRNKNKKKTLKTYSKRSWDLIIIRIISIFDFVSKMYVKNNAV